MACTILLCRLDRQGLAPPSGPERNGRKKAMTSIDHRALIIMLLMTAANGGSDANNVNGDDVVTRRRRQTRERSGDISHGGDTAPTATRGLSSHYDDCCTTSANAPNATSLVSSLLADRENVRIANVSTSSHECYKLFAAGNNNNVDDNDSALVLPRDGGIIMSTGRPDSFCNVNVNNRQSTNWGMMGDDDLGAIVNVDNQSPTTTTTTVQQQLTTIPTHDAVRI